MYYVLYIKECDVLVYEHGVEIFHSTVFFFQHRTVILKSMSMRDAFHAAYLTEFMPAFCAGKVGKSTQDPFFLKKKKSYSQGLYV